MTGASEGPARGLAERGDPAETGRSVLSLRSVAVGVFMLIFTCVYFYVGTNLIHQLNQNRLKSDQEHNMQMAERAMERKRAAVRGEVGVTEVLWRYLPHYTDGVVSPLWPWIAGRFASEDHEIFFVRGKWFHLSFTAVICLLLMLWASRAFSLPAAMNLVLLTGFGVFLPRAVYFQPEPIYYLFFFLAWVFCILILRRNPLWRYGVLGVLLALAYLAKSSVQPLALVFLVVSTAHFLELALIRKQKARELEARGRWLPQNHFVGLALLGVAFLVISGPRLHYSQEAFGNPFHTYTGYWMWMDSFDDGIRFMQENPDRESLEKLPPEEKPSLLQYMSTRTAEENRSRLVEGSTLVAREFFLPRRVIQRKEGEKRPWKRLLPLRGYYIAALFTILLVVLTGGWIRGRKGAGWQRLDFQSGRLVALFVLGTFMLYLLSYGWYAQIGKGERFMLTLYFPLAFSLVWGAETVLRALAEDGRARWVRGLHTVAHLALLGAVGWRLYEIVEHPVFGK